jgi:hypothetical protein
MKQTEEVKINWQKVDGIVVRGHRVASAPSQDYPMEPSKSKNHKGIAYGVQVKLLLDPHEICVST